MKRQRLNSVGSRHARVILLSSGRVCNQEIARHVGCTIQWVRQLIHRFNRDGLTGIQWSPSKHAHGPTTFHDEIIEQIMDVALSSPRKLIGLTQWSLRKLRDYLIGQKIVTKISIQRLNELLRHCDVRLRRTKTWKESKDPLFWEKYRRIQRLYRRRPKNGRRICIDEFGPLNLQPRHGMCLTKPGVKGVERLRATFHRTGGVRHFLAAYDLETGKLEGRFYDRKRAPEFLDFLKWVRRRFRSSGTLHIVLDNYGTHLSHETQRWAKAHRIKFYFTPTNASWLNQIECHFQELKKFTLENSDYETHAEMESVITSYLDWHNGKRDLALKDWKRSSKNRKSPSFATAA
jgi:transposase